MSGAFRYLGIGTSKDGQYKHAECLNHENGTTTQFNHRLFEDIPEGSDFTFRDGRAGVLLILPEQIPVILQADKERREDRDAEVKRIRVELEATGRFIFSNDGHGELSREILTERLEDFWQVAVDRLNADESRWSQRKFTVEEMKSDKRWVEFMELSQEGDRLEWYIWYRDPISAAGGLSIARKGRSIFHCSVWVS